MYIAFNLTLILRKAKALHNSILHRVLNFYNPGKSFEDEFIPNYSNYSELLIFVRTNHKSSLTNVPIQIIIIKSTLFSWEEYEDILIHDMI